MFLGIEAIRREDKVVIIQVYSSNDSWGFVLKMYYGFVVQDYCLLLYSCSVEKLKTR